MTNETEIDTIVIDKVMKFWDLLFCDCCYIGICLLYSPRVWRWSQKEVHTISTTVVFSTCVEVILLIIWLYAIVKSILHVCGGDPQLGDENYEDFEYSPRVWRWSYFCGIMCVQDMVFSTCVEVILSR